MVSEEIWVGIFLPKNTTLHSTKENIHPATPVIATVARTTPTLPVSTCCYTEGSDTSLEAVAHHCVRGVSPHPGWEICAVVTKIQVLGLWFFVSSGVQLTFEPRSSTRRSNWGLQEGEQGNVGAGEQTHGLYYPFAHLGPSDAPQRSEDTLQYQQWFS